MLLLTFLPERVLAGLVATLAAGLLTISRLWPFPPFPPLGRHCQQGNCPRLYLRLQDSPKGPASRHVTSNQLFATMLGARGTPVPLGKSSLRPLWPPENAKQGVLLAEARRGGRFFWEGLDARKVAPRTPLWMALAGLGSGVL